MPLPSTLPPATHRLPAAALQAALLTTPCRHCTLQAPPHSPQSRVILPQQHTPSPALRMARARGQPRQPWPLPIVTSTPLVSATGEPMGVLDSAPQPQHPRTVFPLLQAPELHSGDLGCPVTWVAQRPPAFLCHESSHQAGRRRDAEQP